MNIYPLNSTQEDMLRESNMETMENGFQVTPSIWLLPVRNS